MTKGILDESLLPFYWRATALKPEDYPHAVRMLIDSGVLVELPAAEGPAAGGATKKRLLMPMRLPLDKPALVASRWPAATLGDGQSQLGVRFDFAFEDKLPPGAIERLVAGCGSLPGCLMLECWRGGALLVDEWSGDGRTKALLELSSADADSLSLAADVRGECEPVQADDF